MALLTTDELASIRIEIGDSTPPEDDDLQAIFDRQLTVVGVVREVLSKRLADLRQQPTSFTVVGEYSESNSGRIAALERQLAGLGGDSGSGLSGPQMGQLVRCDPAR